MKSTLGRRLGLAVVLVSFGCLGPAAAEVTLLSRSAIVSDTGAGPSLTTLGPTTRLVSGDGRFVAFVSQAPNLVSGQSEPSSNGFPTYDAFLFDRLAGTTRLVSHRRGTAATAVGADPLSLAISRDGSCVVFASRSAELVNGQIDGNGLDDVFVYDVVSGQVTLISHVAGVPSTASNAPSGVDGFLAVSNDCRAIAYTSQATDLVDGQVDAAVWTDVFLYDRATGTNTLVSHQTGATATAANGESFGPALSGDGRLMAFTSFATNLVAGQVDTNTLRDVFLFDATTGTTTLVSHQSGAATTAGSGGAIEVTLSGDGNYLAYLSTADNLVAGHSDPSSISWDVYLFDRATGVNFLASRSAASATTSGNADSLGGLTLSDDGRYTAFASSATNLVAGQVDAPGDPNLSSDIFLFDRVTSATTLVSHTGGASPSTTAGNRASFQAQMSADGRSVAFTSDSPLGFPGSQGYSDVFLFRRDTGLLELVSRAFDTPNGGALGRSFRPAVSADGRFVAYASSGVDIALFDTNGTVDVFLYDRNAFGSNAFVSRRAADLPSVSGSWDSGGGVLSADGRYAAFLTNASSLLQALAGPDIPPLQVVVADRLTGTVRLGSRATGPDCPGCPGLQDSFGVALSADGSRVAFLTLAGNLGATPSTTPWAQIFSQHLPSESMQLVSHAAASPDQRSNGSAFAPVLSADGRSVAFTSLATDLVTGTDTNATTDVFVQGPGSAITLVSHAAGAPGVAANAGSGGMQISADGRSIAFQSPATNLVAGVSDTNAANDVFLYDRATDSTILVSHAAASATQAAAGDSRPLALSADGRFVLFASFATDLVGGQVDLAGSPDLFLFDRLSGETLLVSRAGSATTAATMVNFSFAALSADGRYSAFWSLHPGLVPGQADTPDTPDLFLFDRLTGDMTLVSRSAGSMVTAAHGNSEVAPQIDADGRFVAWVSPATNVVTGQVDTNGVDDVFVYDRQTGNNRLVSRARGTVATAAAGLSISTAISADGRSILFASSAEDLVANDRNLHRDTFLDRAPTTPGAFFTVPPCRLVDSRTADEPLTASVPRALAVYAACGIPSTATAVSLNLTVVAGDAAGFATLFPGDQPAPATSTLNFRAGQVKANNSVARLALDGSGTLGIVASFAGAGPVHVIVDVNGYFE